MLLFMNKSLHILFVIISVFIFKLEMEAQNNLEKTGLITFINTLEKQHDITFNYDAEVLKTISIRAISPNKTLENTLQELEQQVSIKISKLNERLYTISFINEWQFCATLRDAKTQQPLVAATIQMEGINLISDSFGNVKFKYPRKSVEILVRLLGYGSKTFVIEATHPECLTLSLTQAREPLAPIVLNGFLVKGIDKYINGTIQINYKKFGILPGLIENDVLQTVQALPGVSSVNETVSTINIRGGSNDQNLVLWDGIKMYQSGHFFGLISNFNPQITKNATVIKNGSNATLTDGVSGSILMETDQKVNNNLKVDVGATFIAGDTFIDTPLNKKSSLQIAGRKSLNAYFNTPTYTNYFERIAQNTEVENNSKGTLNSNKNFDFYDVSLRYLYTIREGEKLRINLFNSDNTMSFIESKTTFNEPSKRTSSLTQNNFGAGLFYSRNISEAINTSIQIYESDYKLKAINANVLENQRFLQENILSETGVTILLKYQKFKNATITSGFHFSETEVTDLNDIDNPQFRRLFSKVLRNYAISGQIDQGLNNNKTTISGGFRANYIPKFDKFFFEPRIKASTNINNNWTATLAGEFKHQTTTQVINFQNDFLGVEKRRWQLSNGDDIPLLQSKQISLGADYKRNAWLFSLDTYFKEVIGITTQSQGFQVKYEFTKTVGSYNVKGADLLLRWNSKNVSSWVSYAFMDNNYTFQKLEENSFPSNFDIRHTVTLGVSIASKKLKISGGINWRTGAPKTEPLAMQDPSTISIVYDNANSARLPNYLRVDGSILYTLINTKKSKILLGGSVWNILNKENIIGEFYKKVNENVQRVDQLSLKATFNSIIRVSF